MNPPHLPPPPALQPLTHIECEVGPVVSLGPAPLGVRRYVPLLGGTVSGPMLSGRVLEGGVDWQIQQASGALEIDAHYVIEATDGALIEVRSQGVRHGPREVMERLAAGEDVPAEAYYFRTFVRFTTGAERWSHLNGLLAVARGHRQARCVLLDLYALS